MIDTNRQSTSNKDYYGITTKKIVMDIKLVILKLKKLINKLMLIKIIMEHLKVIYNPCHMKIFIMLL